MNQSECGQLLDPLQEALPGVLTPGAVDAITQKMVNGPDYRRGVVNNVHQAHAELSASDPYPLLYVALALAGATRHRVDHAAYGRMIEDREYCRSVAEHYVWHIGAGHQAA